MRASSLVRDVTIQAKATGITETAAAAEKLGAAVDGAVAANDSFTRSTLSVDRALDRTMRQIDMAYRQSRQFETGQRSLDRALDATRITADEHRHAMDLLAAKYIQAASAANDNAAAQALLAQRAEAYRRVVDPALAAQERFNAALHEAEDLYTAGAVSAEHYRAGVARATAELAAATQAIQRNEAAERARAQGAFNQQLGVRTDFGTASRGEDIAAYGASLEAVRAKFVPLAAAQQQYRASLAEINLAARAGAISEGERVQALARTKESFAAQVVAMRGVAGANDNVRTSSGLARHELINLGRQVQDVGTMFAMGADPMQIFASQAAQIFDIFSSSQGTLRGFLSQVGSGLARFAMSGGGVATGVGLVAGAGALAAHQYANSQREVEVALMGVGRASGLTAQGINRVAEAAEESGRISRSAARDIASIFAGTGRIGADMLPGLTDASKGYSVLTGQSRRDAAQSLAQAFASPTAGAAELEKRLGTLDDATMQFIRNAEASGNRTAAQKALFDAFNPTLVEAASKTSALAKAWDAVARAASGAWDRVGQALGGQATLEERLDAARKKIAAEQDRYGFTRDRSGLKAAQAEEQSLQEELRRRNTLQSNQRRDAEASLRSAEAGDVLRGLFGDEARLQNLRNQKDLLDKTLGDSSAMAKLGPLAGLVSEGVERLKSSIESFAKVNEMTARDADLQVRQINAYTLGQKLAVEMERARVAALDGQRGALQAGIEAEQVRTRVIAEANRQLRDTARDLRDERSLIGLSPFQRSLQEARNQSDREAETLGTGGVPTALPATTAAARGLDAAFSESLRKLMDAVPGLRVTSGFRTYEEQERLYREKGPGWAARPGTSNHERGIAADLSYNGSGQLPGWVHQKAAEFGIQFPLKDRAVKPEPWHAEPVGGRSRAGAANDNASAAANTAARQAKVLEEAYEGWNTPLANSERHLAANIALQKRMAETMFMSSAEITKAAEQQRLLNEYSQQGIPITDSLAAKIDDYARRAADAAESTKYFAAAQEAWRTFGDVGRDFAGGFLRDLKAGKTAAEAFAGSLERLADKILDLAMSDIGKMFNGSGGTGFFASMFRMFGGGGGYNFNGSGAFSYGAGGYTGAGPFLPSANGNAFGYGNVIPFARGGAFTNRIVDRPTLFPFANGTGLMGEAGPEAIMPLRRGRDGRLGVSAGYGLPAAAPAPSAGPMQVTIHNNAPAQVEAREVSDGAGGRKMEIVINEAVGQAMSSAGPTRDALRSNFGAKQRVASR